MGREVALATIAERQFGVFGGSQAIAAGYPRRTIHASIERGAWVRVVGNSYRLASTPRCWQQPIVGAFLAAGTPSAISGRSALAMWELANPSTSPPTVSVPWTRRPRLADVRILRTRRWSRRELVSVGAVVMTSIRRTLLDVAPLISEQELEFAIDSAHRRKLIDPARSMAYYRAAAAAKIPGASTMCLLISLRDPSRPLESHAETLFLRTLRRAGLPVPVPQYRVRTRTGERRLDFAYPAERVAIEVDGYAAHAGRRAFDADRQRDNELADEGWRIRHVTPTMINDHPRDVVWTIATALGLEPKGWRRLASG